MEPNQIDSLTHRLDRLEREKRWWRVLGVVAVSIIGIVMLTGATGNKVVDEIRAKRFVLVDGEGSELGVWEANYFSFHDDKWIGTFSVHLKSGDPILRISGSAGEANLGFPLGSGPRLYLSEKDKVGGVNLGFLHKDTPELFFIGGPEYKGLVTLGVLQTGKIYLQLGEWVSLSVEDGLPTLSLSDNGGAKTILGHTALKTTRTGVVEQRPASSLVLLNKEGKVIWSAP
jgi:hypothetical protein